MTKRNRRSESAVPENELSRAVADEICKRGAITFERFMERALYDKGFGYYSSGAAEIGKKGDFYTSPAAHRAFGETLARLIGVLRKHIDSALYAEKMTVLEVGGGNGGLALDILSALAKTDPDAYNSVEYIIVDRAKPRKCVVSGKHSNFRRVESFSDIGKQISGIVLSNELFDALAFHRLVFRNGRIREICVSKSEDGFIDIETAPSKDKLVKYFDRCGGVEKMGFAEGQRFEVSTSAAKMLKQMSRILKKGVILIIDYGFQTDELFSPDRMAGTFKCVSSHQINESPYENIGKQDITAHVDFGNLEKTGEVSGLETLKYTTQGQFLVDWGIMEIAERNPDDIFAIKNLFMPGMMGDRFRVLMQIKNARKLKNGFYPESPVRISFGVS